MHRFLPRECVKAVPGPPARRGESEVMGLFSFVKDVGEMLGISGGGESDADALKKEVASHGLGADDLEVAVEGDMVKVSGKAASQEEKEKIILSLGNVTGIGSVEESIAVEDEAPEATFYTVQKGDTLWGIASDHYGNGAKYNQIFEANTPMLKHPDKIYPGQVLRIPEAG